MPSSRFYTGAFDTESGFGTNIIGDIYYTFGLMGVVIIMYIVGLFCSSLSSLKNKYIFLMYLIFTGNSIFMARVELLYVVRMLALGCILLYVVNLMSKRNIFIERDENTRSDLESLFQLWLRRVGIQEMELGDREEA